MKLATSAVIKWVSYLWVLLSGKGKRTESCTFFNSPSYSLLDTKDTLLGQALAEQIRHNQGLSGFHLIMTGDEALKLRISMIRSAERSLDLQYYSIRNDITGSLLMDEILNAADRGVRIRILIDGFNLREIGSMQLLLDIHTNIELRAFNPIATRKHFRFAYIANYIMDFSRVTRRMHNKVIIADNQASIIGGRNLSDEYFDAGTEFNFSDVDILLAGPVVQHISRSFDRYWNDPCTAATENLRSPKITWLKIKRMQEKMMVRQRHLINSKQKLSKIYPLDQLFKRDLSLAWAPITLAVDKPSKIEQDIEYAKSRPEKRLHRMIEKTEKECLLVSPYFIPQKEGVRLLKDIASQGITIKVLTNSLSSTDVIPVHSAYQAYRKDILDAGIDLYEFKPDVRPHKAFKGSFSPASLHAKIFIVDRRIVTIGSFNFDPRSIELNTELVITVESQALALQVFRMFEQTVRLEESYRVKLGADGKLVWETVHHGEMKRYHRDPEAGIKRQLVNYICSFLPLERQL